MDCPRQNHNEKSKRSKAVQGKAPFIHQNRAKRQKKEIDYLEMNIGKGCAQPRSKSKPKKIDIVAALGEPSETWLAAHQIQLEHQNSQPGQILGVAIKSEIKSEIKQELEQRNTGHRYKGKPLSGNVNYIHLDGTPCRSSMRKEAKLPDLPTIDNPENDFTNGLQVETQHREQRIMTTSRSVDSDTENTTNKTGLPVEMPKTIVSEGHQNLNNGPDKTMIPEASDSEGLLLITNNPTAELNVHIHEPKNNVATANQNELPVEMKIGIQEANDSGEPLVDAYIPPGHPVVGEPKNNLAPTNQKELPVETKTVDDTDLENVATLNQNKGELKQLDKRNELTAAATGLIMLEIEGNDPLLEK